MPLTSSSNQDILHGGLFAAITQYAKESFNSELNQIRLEGNIILFKRTNHLMGSIVLREEDSDKIKEAEIGLGELLAHLENMCPELEQEQLDAEKIEYLVQQYSSNLMD